MGYTYYLPADPLTLATVWHTVLPNIKVVCPAFVFAAPLAAPVTESFAVLDATGEVDLVVATYNPAAATCSKVFALVDGTTTTTMYDNTADGGNWLTIDATSGLVRVKKAHWGATTVKVRLLYNGDASAYQYSPLITVTGNCPTLSPEQDPTAAVTPVATPVAVISPTGLEFVIPDATTSPVWTVAITGASIATTTATVATNAATDAATDAANC